MDVRELLLTYGPIIVFIWTFFEGETVLLVAGFLAQQGYMSLGLAMLAAACGSMLGDQLYFWVGRKFGQQILEWRPGWRVTIDRALRLLVRYQNLFILSFRFVYVVRNIASFSIGLAGVTFRRFALLNGIAAAVWALSFGFGGYYFGKTMELLLGRVRAVEFYAIGALFGLALLGFIGRQIIKRRRATRGAHGAVPEASGNE
jgi:membrane protein DedA with SNARE-associated domain